MARFPLKFDMLFRARIRNFSNSIRFSYLLVKDRFNSVEGKTSIHYLEEQEGSVKDGGRAGDVKDELFEAREGRQ
jgi:hypothetical protein